MPKGIEFIFYVTIMTLKLQENNDKLNREIKYFLMKRRSGASCPRILRILHLIFGKGFKTLNPLELAEPASSGKCRELNGYIQQTLEI